jgi:predicted amidohydrolase
VRALAQLARAKDMWIVAGVAERAGRRCYNSAVIVGPAGWRGTYRKAHLFHEEKRWFAPGAGPFPVYDIGAARVGVMVCFDWFFPEVARALALAGADVIAHPSNLVLPYCPEAMITRCLENRVFAVTANRSGTEARGGKRRLTYIGQSEIVAPDGRVLVRAGVDEARVGLATIDLRAARDKRLNRFNHLLRDRRAALYRPLVRPLR